MANKEIRLYEYPILNFFLLFPHVLAVGTLGFAYALPFVLFGTLGIVAGCICTLYFLLLPLVMLVCYFKKIDLY